MITKKIIDTKTGKQIISFSDEDLELVDPVKYYHDSFILKRLILCGISDEELKGQQNYSKKSKSIFKESEKLWNNHFSEIINTPIPAQLITLLHTTKKSIQESLLKRLDLNPITLTAFIFEAYSKYGFKYSQYITENQQNGIDLAKMPLVSEIIDNSHINILGHTEYSDKQIKHVIQNRKVIIGKFIEKDDIWHCFFTNYNNLSGKERWLNQNQPHLHYISNSYEIDKQTVINELKSAKYKLGNPYHIKFLDYGIQPK